jgi:hypothetical protein
MKTKRNLSGMFFRYKAPEAEKFDNVCFEDLPESEQDRILNMANPEFMKGIVKILANTLNEMSEKFDIIKG